MINIYDGNSVMIRAMTGAVIPGQKKLSIRQRLAFAQPTDIWVWDGPAHNKRRQDIYPPYKAKRPPLAEDIFAQISLFKELLCHTPATQITVHGWEADDVVATMVKRHNGLITVHSGDVDYYQLLRQPNVVLNCPTKPPCSPRWICMYKALVGDKSDFIDGIPGFGPKAWESTAPYREELEAAIRLGSPHSFHALPLPKALLRWLALPESLTTLQNMFLITHMWDVPMDELNAGITVGTPNPTTIETTLRKFFL